MKRSKHSLSNYKLLSCNMGNLVPIGLTEVLMGDSFQHATSVLLRCSPMLAPVMHPVHVRVHHWFVPHRLVWDDWEDFITGGEDGNNASVFPTITFGGGSGAAVGSLADYLGIPTGVDGLEVSALPFRGYNLIFNEWYRDQDLVAKAEISKASGADTTTDTDLLRVAWEKDYFTAARPWEQKGDAVTVPLSGKAPVTGLGKGNQIYNVANQAVYETGQSGTKNYANTIASSSGNGLLYIEEDPNNAGFPAIYADLSNASGLSVTAMREYFGLQRFKEARALTGSRYSEYLRYYGITPSDARLQRPEYLGGGRQTLQFSEVLQTAEGTNPVGEMRGHGISAVRSNRYRRFFEEHGYVFSFLSVKPKAIYADGLPRTFNRRIKEDFWTMELQHIGQQTVLNKELYAAHTTPDGTFGFQGRYDEYRSQQSSIAGEFRESSLNMWHFARSFESDPALNDTFVECTPTENPFAVQSEDVLYVMAMHSLQARRLVAAKAKYFIY